MASWLNTEHSGKPGYPYVYGDAAVECVLLLKQVFDLALQQTQGFMQSVFQLMGQDLPVLSYSQLSRRHPKTSLRGAQRQSNLPQK